LNIDYLWYSVDSKIVLRKLPAGWNRYHFPAKTICKYVRIISKLVVVEYGKIMGVVSKQNGHPVSQKDISLICEDKHYPKEACDVRTHYSTILSLSSNQNYKTDHSFQYQQSLHPYRIRQTIPSCVLSLWGKGHRDSQLDRAYDTRPEPGEHPCVDNLSLSKTFLYKMWSYNHRKFRFVPSVLKGNPPSGILHSSVMSVYDGQ
jgi:hypothetical protein